VYLTKNDVVAYRKFTELLYGEEHPYGYNSFADTYSALTRDDLVEHYQANYVSGNCLLFLSGKITPQIRALMEQHLGNAILKGEKRTVAVGPGVNTPLTVKVPHPEKVQTAIRIGSHLFTRSHPDYNGMYVLNTILGGYFGSRLMANIREEKGYTYNIYSNHDSMLFGGYFYVATEVGNEFVEPTIREIYVEMQKLQDKLVKKDEMEMVRNYLLGTLLTNLDGPFNISEVVKTFISEGLPLSGFEELVETIKTISPKELRELARKYFKKENLWEVVV
jgi:predicted Zn-dependent peptidase